MLRQGNKQRGSSRFCQHSRLQPCLDLVLSPVMCSEDSIWLVLSCTIADKKNASKMPYCLWHNAKSREYYGLVELRSHQLLTKCHR